MSYFYCLHVSFWSFLSGLCCFCVFVVILIILSTVEEGQRSRQGQERPGGSSRQHRQRASHPYQTGETLSPFEASALINSEITHLTSIRAKGSPESCNQIIRRRRGKGFLFLQPPPVPLFVHFTSPLIGCSPRVGAAVSKHISQLVSANRRLP